jgi:hypothetical protein
MYYTYGDIQVVLPTLSGLLHTGNMEHMYHTYGFVFQTRCYVGTVARE